MYKKIILTFIILCAWVGIAFATTATFTISSGANDADAWTNGESTYPPSGINYSSGYNYSQCQKTKDGGSIYKIGNGFLRFDTSSIPDDATITSAKLILYMVFVDDTNSRNVNCEYFTWAGNSTDYADPVGTSAFSYDLSTGWTMGAYNDFTLSNLSSISLDGYTSFRFGISGGQPAGFNDFAYQEYDYGSSNRYPKLEVTYTVPTPPGIPGNPTFTNVANKSMTVSWSAATGATSYTLQRGGSNISTNASSPYNDSGLAVATSYTYRVIAVNGDGSTNCAADQSQTTTYWSKKMNGSTVKKINGTYVDKVNGL